MISLPPIAAPAVPGGGTAAPVQPLAPTTAVQAVGPSEAAAGGHHAGLSDHRDPPPRPAERRKPTAGPVHAPVVSLIRQAEAVCRIANTAAEPAPRPEGYALTVAQAQGGLQVSGQLIVEGEAGLEIGSGRIYRSGELVASFTGPNLAFVGGKVDRLL